MISYCHVVCVDIRVCIVHLQLKVMDNKLFTIEPMKGKLCPGETSTVTLTYKHTMVGNDRLPVVFKLSRGREILVRLQHSVSARTYVDVNNSG